MHYKADKKNENMNKDEVILLISGYLNKVRYNIRTGLKCEMKFGQAKRKEE
jgi:hypothetical protein